MKIEAGAQTDAELSAAEVEASPEETPSKTPPEETEA
jgi:hypothetical protein